MLSWLALNASTFPKLAEYIQSNQPLVIEHFKNNTVKQNNVHKHLNASSMSLKSAWKNVGKAKNGSFQPIRPTYSWVWILKFACSCWFGCIQARFLNLWCHHCVFKTYRHKLHYLHLKYWAHMLPGFYRLLKKDEVELDHSESPRVSRNKLIPPKSKM